MFTFVPNAVQIVVNANKILELRLKQVPENCSLLQVPRSENEPMHQNKSRHSCPEQDAGPVRPSGESLAFTNPQSILRQPTGFPEQHAQVVRKTLEGGSGNS